MISLSSKKGFKEISDIIIMSNSETESKAKIVDRKKYDAKYYERVGGIKVACELCSREVTRRNLPNHKRTKTCKRIAEERLHEKIQKIVDLDSSSSDEPTHLGPIMASREVCEQMWEETKAPGFDFDKWFARWCPDDGQTVCYTIEDEYEPW